MSHARLLFVDSSSAFNLIQPPLLAKKIFYGLKLDFNISGWILDV